MCNYRAVQAEHARMAPILLASKLEAQSAPSG
jgi:hypothetical protein